MILSLIYVSRGVGPLYAQSGGGARAAPDNGLHVHVSVSLPCPWQAGWVLRHWMSRSASRQAPTGSRGGLTIVLLGARGICNTGRYWLLVY